MQFCFETNVDCRRHRCLVQPHLLEQTQDVLGVCVRQPPTDYNCLFLARVKEWEDTSDDADEIVGTPLVYLLMESDVVKSWKISISDSDDEYQIRLVASCAVGEDQVFDFVLAKNQ